MCCLSILPNDVLGILGSLASLIGVGLTVFLYRLGRKLQERSDELAKETHMLATGLRLDQIRSFYELSKDQPNHKYWTFRWRFETFDFLGLSVSDNYGHFYCRVRIKGQTNDPSNIGLERKSEEDGYLVEAVELKKDEKRDALPFDVGTTLFCFSQGNDLKLTQGDNSLTLEPQFNFEIVGLGAHTIHFGKGNRKANELRAFHRMKDKIQN